MTIYPNKLKIWTGIFLYNSEIKADKEYTENEVEEV